MGPTSQAASGAPVKRPGPCRHHPRRVPPRVLRRHLDPGPRRPGGGPQAPRHVHRLDRRARSAPPGLRGRRQLRRRGARRLRDDHRRHAARRRRRPRRRQRSRHPGRHRRERGQARPSRSSSPCCTPAASSAASGYKVSGGLHGVGVSVVNACRPRLHVEVRRDGYVWRHSRTGRCAGRAARSGRSRDTETGTTITFWASDEIFETTDYSFETLSTRFREMAFLNKGLTISMRDERTAIGDEDEDIERPRASRARSSTATTTGSSTTSSTSTPTRRRRTAASSPSRRSRPTAKGNR